MEKKLRALKLVLDELDIPHEIATFRDRKRVQKAIYLAQVGGADLGYRYNWYVHGPYSPSLTRDYFRLEEALAAEEASVPRARLHPKFAQLLEKVKPTLESRAAEFSQEDWLELLASVHYQMDVLGRSTEATREYLEGHSSKQRLVSAFEQAIEILKEIGLI